MRTPAFRAGRNAWAACGLILALLALSAVASAEEMDTLNRVASEQGFDAASFIQRIISGESFASLASLDKIPALIKRQILQGLSALTLNLALPVLACLLMRMTAGEGGAGFMLDLLCVLCCAKALTRSYLDAQAEVRNLIEAILRTTERVTPAMVSVAALTGGSFWSSAIGPVSNLCVSFMQRVLSDWGFKLCNAAAIVALSGAIAGKYGLDRLFDLVKAVSHWLLGGVIFLYGGLVSAQGLVSTARDGAAVNTAKVAMENLIPIIGGGISGAAGSLAVSAGLARSAVGITGVVLVARRCAGPMLKLGGQTLALKLVSAAMEPLVDGASAKLIGHFGDILETLLAMAIGCAAMAAMLPAAFAALSGSLFQ